VAGGAQGGGHAPDLERLGVWDPDRSRRRLLEELAPASTWLVLAAGQRVGSVALRPGMDEELQHFYVLPEHQGRGLGGAVLRELLDRRDHPRPVRLLAVRGSGAALVRPPWLRP
jgi:GNAT superfamily N-acetyltransferase